MTEKKTILKSSTLKLITLNIWGGRIREPIIDFFNKNKDIDIFCLQEVYHNAPNRISNEEGYLNLNFFGEVGEILSGHTGYFKPLVKGIYGIGIFIKNSIKVLDEGEVLIYENPDYEGIGPRHSRILQWIKCSVNNQKYTILNMHGLWNGKGKTDSPKRLLQSKIVKEFILSLDTPVILCGDFNLEPNTESLAIIADGMTDLIKEYKVTSTRTSFYPKEIRFADYIFTSPEIETKSFKVLEDEVSDHNALEIEFL